MKRELKVCVVSLALVGAVLGAGCGRQNPPPPQQSAGAPPQGGYAQPAPPPAAGYAPAPPPPAAYGYYYYPDVEVYYYPVGDIYWWFDGIVWVSGPRPPPRFVLRDDVRVRVFLDTDRPWIRHQVVVREHPRFRR